MGRVTCDGDLTRVQVSTVCKDKDASKGVYAPLTECGTVVVEGILCSCYADIFPGTAMSFISRLAAAHEAAHSALFPLRLVARLGLSSKAPEPQKGIHPFCRALLALPMTAQTVA